MEGHDGSDDRRRRELYDCVSNGRIAFSYRRWEISSRHFRRGIDLIEAVQQPDGGSPESKELPLLYDYLAACLQERTESHPDSDGGGLLQNRADLEHLGSLNNGLRAPLTGALDNFGLTGDNEHNSDIDAVFAYGNADPNARGSHHPGYSTISSRVSDLQPVPMFLSRPPEPEVGPGGRVCDDALVAQAEWEAERRRAADAVSVVRDVEGRGGYTGRGPKLRLSKPRTVVLREAAQTWPDLLPLEAKLLNPSNANTMAHQALIGHLEGVAACITLGQLASEAVDPASAIPALHLACRRGHAEVVGLLCDAGADPLWPCPVLDHERMYQKEGLVATEDELEAFAPPPEAQDAVAAYAAALHHSEKSHVVQDQKGGGRGGSRGKGASHMPLVGKTPLWIAARYDHRDVILTLLRYQGVKEYIATAGRGEGGSGGGSGGDGTATAGTAGPVDGGSAGAAGKAQRKGVRRGHPLPEYDKAILAQYNPDSPLLHTKPSSSSSDCPPHAAAAAAAFAPPKLPAVLCPLHAAARTGHSECIRVLCDAGADPNVADDRDPLGASAAAEAAAMGHGDSPTADHISRYREEAFFTPALLAARHGHAVALKELFKGGADLNVCTVTGDTPLSLAVAGRHYPAVEALLSTGKSRDENNFLAMEDALVNARQYKLVDMLTARHSTKSARLTGSGRQMRNDFMY